jgi:pectin methylesterase-like acyl-CoA thioesterase
MLAFSLLFSVLSVFPISFERFLKGQPNATQQNSSPVRNLNTGKNYSAIQWAIDDSETLDGHEISVGSGIYYEHVTVDK